jgi:hypothetical protein
VLFMPVYTHSRMEDLKLIGRLSSFQLSCDLFGIISVVGSTSGII